MRSLPSQNNPKYINVCTNYVYDEGCNNLEYTQNILHDDTSNEGIFRDIVFHKFTKLCAKQ
jgi:hypothetical protein